MDPFAPMAGGSLDFLGWKYKVPPALDSACLWAQSHHMSDKFIIHLDNDKLTICIWGPTASGAEVHSIVVKGHGHAYLSPKVKFKPIKLFGPTVNSINATETIWKFFVDHPK